MTDKLSREECLLLLCERAAQINRLPKKADFAEHEVVRIKAYFGPWPRALEAAGLKEPRPGDKLAKGRGKCASVSTQGKRNKSGNL